MEYIETTISEHVFNQGKVESKKETALNLLKMGMDAKFISQATGLKEDEIRELQTSRLQIAH